MSALQRRRADQLLVERGLAESRAKAQALILAGLVFSGEARVDKPGTALRLDAALEVRGQDVFIPGDQEMKIKMDMGGHTPKLDDGPWPAFPADVMSTTIVTATQCSGMLLVFEKMFESRLFFVDKLIGMGARIVLCDPHRAVISGPSPLNGGTVESPDIRAGMAMLLAALAADGTSTIHNIGQIERGYEQIDVRLRELGADIQRLDD